MIYAARHNQNTEVIEALLTAGADIDARDVNGWTALMIAAEGNKNPEVITVLLKASADVKALDKVAAYLYKRAEWYRAQKGQPLCNTRYSHYPLSLHEANSSRKLDKYWDDQAEPLEQRAARIQAIER
mgnify:CR=1 FL=1